MIFGGGNTGSIGVGIAYSLHDNFSATSDKITAKYETLASTTERGAVRMNKAMAKIRTGFVAMVAGAVVIGALAMPVKNAIEYESAFTGVRKTVKASEPEFEQLSQNFRNIAKETPIAVTELARIGELAGQLGVEGVQNLTDFTETISQLAVTTNLSSEAAATDLARISNIMQEPITNIGRMGSSVVDLGNSFATTESEIVNFANRIAGAGKIAGLSTADIFGMGAAFSSVGVGAERGGTAVGKTLFKMTAAVKNGGEELEQFGLVAGITGQAFKDAFEKDAAGAFNLFIAGLGKKGIQGIKLLDDLKLSDSRLQQAFVSVAGAGNTMTKAIAKSSLAWKENHALTHEAELRYGTLASQLDIMKNNFFDASLTIGNMFTPVVRVISAVMKGLAGVLGFIAKTVVGKVLLGVAAALASVLFFGGLVLVMLGATRWAAAKAAIQFTALGKAQIAAAFASRGLAGGLRVLAVSAWSAMIPFLPFIIIAGAVVGIIVLMVKSVKQFDKVLKGNAEPAKGFVGMMQRIGGILKAIMHIWKSATDEGFSLSGRMHDALKKMGLLEMAVNLGTWIVRLKAFFGGVGEAIKMVWGVVKSVARFVKDALNSLIDVLNSLGFNFGKLGGNMEGWALAGKIVGGIIVTILIIAIISLTVAMWNLAAAVIAATWPFVLIIVIIALIVLAIIYWEEILDWFISLFTDWWDSILLKIEMFKMAWSMMVDWISGLWQDFMDWLSSIGQWFYELGESIINGIVDGLKAAWQGIKDFFSWLWDQITAPIEWLVDWISGDDELPEGGTITNEVVNGDGVGDLGTAISDTKAAQAQAGSTTVNKTTKQITQEITIPVEIDGREVGRAATKFETENDSRE